MILRNILVACFSVTLVACGGGGDKTPEVDTTAVSGTLVIPETVSVSSARAVAAKNANLAGRLAASVACPNVPAGYSPLQNTSVSFVDASGTELETSTTDDCGVFSANVPAEVVQAKATSTGNKEIVADIDVFTSTTATNVVSTIPTAASYQIASIQSVGSDEIAFSITDTVTNKAVIGIPDSAFKVSINAAPTTITTLESSASTADPATVTLILDASGSMAISARDEQGDNIEDANGNNYSRERLTAVASHTFLDNVATGDETGIVIFGSGVFLIDDAVLANIALEDQANNSIASYAFSADGYSSSSADMRFIVDLYNSDSKLFGSSGIDDIHPDTPNVLVQSSTPWGFSTALYEAISTGISKTSARSNTRKIVIAMSDGLNNGSGSVDDVIAEANAASIPVYTVSYEAGDNDSMKRIADETNATTFVVNGADLSGAFQSIQTGITFQYIAGFVGSTVVGDTITLDLNLNGETVSRTLTR